VTSPTYGGKPKELPILEMWSGDYPVSQLNRLPEGQSTSRVGCFGNVVEFAGVWKAFKPDENSIKTDGVLSSDRIMNMLYCLGIPKAELDRYLKSGSS